MKRGRYSKTLKVCSPDGERIYAIITPQWDTVHVEVRFLEVVKKDKPQFAQNGVIRFTCPKEGYTETITKLTSYIESLFLKEMDKEGTVDESIYSSLGIKPQRGRDKKTFDAGQTKSFVGERDLTSVHDSARGQEHAESTGEGKRDIDLDSGGSAKAGGKDKNGD